MKESFLPQYAAQAIISLEKTSKMLGTGSNPQAPAYGMMLAMTAALLRCAVHIILPINAEIYRENTKARARPTPDECESFVGIPAPVVALQYPWNIGSDQESGCLAPKRITLDIDEKQIFGTTLEKFRTPGLSDKSLVQIMSIYWEETARHWLLEKIMLHVAQPLVVTDVPSAARWGWLGAARCAMTGKFIEQESIDRVVLGAMAPDLTALTQCCHALRAGAHLEENTEQSSSRRRKFTRKGVGGFVYHVLKIPGQHTGYDKINSGTHASPRLHVRRAHIRKLPTGVLTFVRQCFVGDPNIGVVGKHYKMENRDEVAA